MRIFKCASAPALPSKRACKFFYCPSLHACAPDKCLFAGYLWKFQTRMEPSINNSGTLRTSGNNGLFAVQCQFLGCKLFLIRPSPGCFIRRFLRFVPAANIRPIEIAPLLRIYRLGRKAAATPPKPPRTGRPRMEKKSPGRSYGIRGAASPCEQAQRLQGMRRSGAL